jgi:arabinose-5-phosphate isomerase
MQSDSILTNARAVIEQEAIGLNTLADSLGDAFVDAVCIIHALKGRLIVSGMGKSGHIARKIAATMASTGTPAYYVHPAEASHGDLGMITKQDAILALSNSGETTELADLLAYAKRFSIPLIAVTSRSPSALADAATITLLLPDVPEASPVNAPTTSTTMMLGMGDALAVALLEKRGFTKEDFATYHPGGKLGKTLLRVENIMHAADALPLVNEQALMKDVLLVITAKHFGCAGVVDTAGKLIGAITDGDLRRHMSTDLMNKTAREVMNAAPKTIAPLALAAEALGMMNEKSITSLFVVESGTPVGILHIHDCLRAGIA